MTVAAWLFFILAAVLEVGGDAVVRHGLRNRAILYVLTGCVMLACYGIVVNRVTWHFSRLMGVYVCVFALVSVLVGRYCLAETIPLTTWIGLGLILAGGFVIQSGLHG